MYKDNFKYGLALGALAPFIGMLFFYFWKFGSSSLSYFISVLSVEKRLLTSMVTFSLIANAVVFTIFINGHKDKTAKGIFTATCVWALAAIALKWFS